MSITAKDVAELRARTGAGMMDCKRALEEAGGDLPRAIELLRAKGIAKAEKRSGRTTSQGLVAGLVGPEGSRGAMLQLTCETDFVARTEDFGRAADEMAALLLERMPAGLEAFLALPLGTGTVADRVKELSGKTGEGVSLPHAVTFDAGAGGVVGLYLHHNRLAGGMVELSAPGDAARRPETRELARELALHVVSAVPLAVRGEDIPAEVLERERRIAEEQVAGEGKPENIRPKIVEGKLRKFVAEQSLLEQPWVKDEKKPVKQLVQDTGHAIGAELTVTRFVRIRVGEVG